MIRILVYLAIVLLIGLGLAWLADRPGDMVVTFEGYRYQLSLVVAATAVIAVVAAVLIAWWLVKGIWNSPHAVSRFFRARRRDRGYQALSTGLIAAGSGDVALARRKNAEAQKLIRADQEPLLHILEAQTALMEGDFDAARKKFDAMVGDPETRLLGLRGLYLEAERSGDRSAARHYAGRAAELAPQLGWAAGATLEERTLRGDWDGALKLIEARKPVRKEDKDAQTRERAVLLTAKSIAVLDTDPAAARSAALEANRIRPDFVPAALAAARALFRLGDLRKGAKLLEAVWKREAHPQIADLYVNARPGDSTHDRLGRARKLQAIKQNNAEASLAVGRAALAAGEFSEAREAAQLALRMAPRESTYLLLADIEEADGGNEGRMRQYLSRAVRAPRDPVWVADGFVSEEWAPFSPVTGKLDAFEWRVPVERLNRLGEAEEVEDTSALPAASVPAKQVAYTDAAVEPMDAGTVPASPAPDADGPTVLPPGRMDGNGATSRPALSGLDSPQDDGDENPMPDDPGVDGRNAVAEPQRRFRLF